MPPATLAVVQTDIALADTAGNRAMVLRKLHAAADAGAELIAFPECVLNGYGFASRAAALETAEPVPGPTTQAVAEACAARGVWCVFGLLERAGDKLYNSAAVVGPRGLVGCYRKTHLPLVGADKFTDPGPGPLGVFDLDGLKVGVGVCFDAGFPELPRALGLLGADLIVTITNWAEKAATTARVVPPARALENGVFFAACNRVGTESGFQYIGRSSIYDPTGTALATADHDAEAVLSARIDPELARRKKVVNTPGEYEVDRVNWRRPELYGVLTQPLPVPFTGHGRSLDPPYIIPMLTLVCVSDTHGRHRDLAVPPGDVLLFAGDLSNHGDPADVSDFNDWLGTLPHPHKVMICGNHDFHFETDPADARRRITNATYLQDDGCEVAGLSVWGSPWQPRFFDWAFNLDRGPDLAAKWALIPDATDILITHGPPAGILDRTFRGEHTGCANLLERVTAVKPKLHLFGHIHEGAGVLATPDTLFVNASIGTARVGGGEPVMVTWDGGRMRAG